MKRKSGETNPIKYLVIFTLFSSILIFKTAYSDQRKTVPDNTPPGLVRDTCLKATPRLAKIPELNGFWNPAFPAPSDSVWHFSGANSAKTWMIYAGMSLRWPYKYLRYTAKGEPPNYRWEQDKELEAYYSRGSINVTISTGQGRSTWGDDWRKRAESHNRIYANRTITIYSMGQAPKILTEVLPGPTQTCEYKQKQYCDGRFQAEFLIYRDKYRLERYAIAGRGSQYRSLNRIIARDHITSIRARVKGTNPALEVSVHVANKDGKPMEEVVVDKMITVILGAAFEASGLTNPCGDIYVPEEYTRSIFKGDLAWVIGDVEVSIDNGPWRQARNEQVTRGDRIRTGANGRVRIFWAVPPSVGHYYIELGPNSEISFTRVYSTFRREQEEARWGPQLTRGIIRVWRKVRSAVREMMERPVTIRASGVACAIQGTDVIIHHDPATRFLCAYVIEGRVEMKDERTGAKFELAEGQKISVREGNFSPVLSLSRTEWNGLIAKHGFESGDVPPAKDYIPELKAEVTDIKFFEGGKSVVPLGQREYGEEFSRSDSRYIYWELNLRHPAPRRRLPFDIDAVWYSPEGREFARQTLNTYMDAKWKSSKYTIGRGWMEPGKWKPGTYRVELFFKGRKVAAGGFAITEGRERIEKKVYDIPSIQANVKSVRFYEGGYNAPPTEERVYGTRFNRATTRYVWWELSLIHPAPGKRRDFRIRHIWRRGDGSVLANQEMGTFILDSWTNSEHCHSWGSPNVSNWQPGRYSLELYIAGKMIAQGSFQIY